MHQLKHERLGEMELLLVPVGQDKEGFQYQAVFILDSINVGINRCSDAASLLTQTEKEKYDE
jgi:hypothetical protein